MLGQPEADQDGRQREHHYERQQDRRGISGHVMRNTLNSGVSAVKESHWLPLS